MADDRDEPVGPARPGQNSDRPSNLRSNACEIDSKAIEILKANLLLIGVSVTGISILVQTDLEVARSVNVFSVAACVLLLYSTALAGVTYTSSNLRTSTYAGARSTIRRRSRTPWPRATATGSPTTPT